MLNPHDPEIKYFNEPVTAQTKFVSRVTKVTLLHTDATSSEIKLILPIYTLSGDDGELSNTYLSQFIKHLTRYHLSLIGY